MVYSADLDDELRSCDDETALGYIKTILESRNYSSPIVANNLTTNTLLKVLHLVVEHCDESQG